MNSYVLIHGACHGAWCWDKVVSLLTQKGHTALAIDLPGHGQDKTPIKEITLEKYIDRVCEVLDEQSEPVILVGHSLGGIIISQAAEQRPEKIKLLVYLSAFLLHDGEIVQARFMEDTESLLGRNVILSKDQSYVTVKEESMKEVWYHDCSDEDVAYAKANLVPQANAPGITPISISEANFGRVPRVYIECLQDKTLTPAFQKKMYTSIPCQRVISMDTSHSPFFSAPEELADHLVSLT